MHYYLTVKVLLRLFHEILWRETVCRRSFGCSVPRHCVNVFQAGGLGEGGTEGSDIGRSSLQEAIPSTNICTEVLGNPVFARILARDY